ncbi:hypothetical protein B0A48_15228 [Cryoendolithus antarcticus]|uniref:Uncharacterized protein n=1 Tax=Cryoendolithus antarcticus TaxID=1507870 RepID=A0A1V8SIB9_9PEZI|nr:hypothetical protein B0A48_15228 [Cryoendolithus antarcticus]
MALLHLRNSYLAVTGFDFSESVINPLYIDFRIHSPDAKKVPSGDNGDPHQWHIRHLTGWSRAPIGYRTYSPFNTLSGVFVKYLGIKRTLVSFEMQRTDGVTVSCGIPKTQRVFDELKATGRLFLGSKFILVIPLIAQSVFAEAVFFTFIGSWYSVRARALGSFLSGIVALVAGNILGQWLDRSLVALGYYRDKPVYDWTSGGFGTGFAWFHFMVLNFQVNYMYLYFVIGNLAESDGEFVRYAGLLRGTESAVQAVSYGLCSIPVMGQVSCIYLNFGLWAVAIVPAWLVIKNFGIGGDKKLAREGLRVTT